MAKSFLGAHKSKVVCSVDVGTTVAAIGMLVPPPATVHATDCRASLSSSPLSARLCRQRRLCTPPTAARHYLCRRRRLTCAATGDCARHRPSRVTISVPGSLVPPPVTVRAAIRRARHNIRRRHRLACAPTGDCARRRLPRVTNSVAAAGSPLEHPTRTNGY